MGGDGRRIRVSALGRVEGEGALHLEVRGGRVEVVHLELFEPPRFFEALLRGRQASEAPDLTSRICGICPIAYQMSAVHALEAALGIVVEGPIRDLRRLVYCGEWIASHALHIAMLHAPDFLGYPDAIQLAKAQPRAVERGLLLKRAGNELMAAIGGRAIHPINVRLGGFHRGPAAAELRSLREPLQRARDEAREMVRWVGAFEFPAFERDYELVALRHPSEYPLNEGRLVSSQGLDLDPRGFADAIIEEQVPRSTALQASIRGRGAYLTGPLARYSLNFDRLPPPCQEAAREAGLGPVCRNPFQSIVVRAVEVLFACEEALRIIDAYAEPEAPAAAEMDLRAGEGCAITEAPRGALYHRYRLDAQGLIAEASIVPPTSQNQRSIEGDLREVAQRGLHLDDAALARECERAIRNHDPCISCATHFLRVTVERR